MAMNVSFARGSSTGFQTLIKDPNTLYFITDTNEIFLGGERYGFGKDVSVMISGTGDVVRSVEWDSPNKILTFVLGFASDIPSIREAINSVTNSSVGSITTDRSSAILVDDTDPRNVKLSLNLAEGEDAGNVRLTQTSSGLKADANIPDVTTSVDVTSTDSEVPTAKAVWDIVQTTTKYPGAMHFLGISTTRISDGERQIPTIGGEPVPISEIRPGDVVLYSPTSDSNYLEFVWDGEKWVQLGDESSYALNTTQIIAGNGLQGGGTLASDITLSHADTGGREPSQYVGPHVTSAVTRINVDDFGHIQDVEFSEVSIGDLHTRTSVLEVEVSNLKARVDAITGGQSLQEMVEEAVEQEFIRQGMVWMYPEDVIPDEP